LTWLPNGPGLAKCLTQCWINCLVRWPKDFCLIPWHCATSSGQTNWFTQYVVLILSNCWIWCQLACQIPWCCANSCPPPDPCHSVVMPSNRVLLSPVWEVNWSKVLVKPIDTVQSGYGFCLPSCLTWYES